MTGKPIADTWRSKYEEMGFSVANGSAEVLRALGFSGSDLERELTEEELRVALQDAEVYIYGGLEPATKLALTGATSLKFIAFMGTGWSDPGCVDPEAAAELHISVSNTPHANALSVAEMTVSAMLGLSRHAFAMAADTAGGAWSPIQGHDLAGKSVGIVGLGAIGSRVARCLSLGFGMQVRYFGPHPKAVEEQELGVERVLSLHELCALSDIITIHAPANESTFGLLGLEHLASCRTGTLLVNMAAPEIVDADAVVESLSNGKVAAAAFDGKYPEPAINDKLHEFGLDRYVQFPRSAWLTAESYERIAVMCFESVSGYLRGVDIPNLVLAG